MSEHNIDELLKFDPLLEAEKISGKSYKSDDATSSLGMLMALRHNEAMHTALSAIGDTYYRMTADYFLGLLSRAGFAKLFERPIQSQHIAEPGDVHYIFYKADEGLLVNFDTYWSHTGINGGNLYFNWEAGEAFAGWPDHCSGGYSPGYYDSTPRRRILCGHLNIKEGLFHNLNRMRANGVFLRKWVDRPFLWLLSYEDTQNKDGYDHVALTAERIATLPAEVQTALAQDRG